MEVHHDKRKDNLSNGYRPYFNQAGHNLAAF